MQGTMGTQGRVLSPAPREKEKMVGKASISEEDGGGDS